MRLENHYLGLSRQCGEGELVKASPPTAARLTSLFTCTHDTELWCGQVTYEHQFESVEYFSCPEAVPRGTRHTDTD